MAAFGWPPFFTIDTMYKFLSKKSVVALCSTLALIGCSTATHTEQEYNAFVRQADSLYMAGNYGEANLSFANAFKCKKFIQDNHLYNGACVAALAGDADNAFARLNMRMKRNKDWYVDDPLRDNDLKALHSDARWEKYVAEMSARKERIEKDYDKPLREQLKRMVREDQAVRYEYINAWQTGNSLVADSLLKRMQYVDSVNLRQVTDILDGRGWVGRDVIGDACEVFWVIIQHAGLEAQGKYLPLFREAVARGELQAGAVAMMEDRVAVFEGRPQKYGSQLQRGEDGTYTPFELLDAEKVDEWRAEVGMEPLAEYLKQMSGR